MSVQRPFLDVSIIFWRLKTPTLKGFIYLSSYHEIYYGHISTDKTEHVYFTKLYMAGRRSPILKITVVARATQSCNTVYILMYIMLSSVVFSIEYTNNTIYNTI